MEKTKTEVLIERIRQKYKGAYSINDDAHQCNHFRAVFNTGIHINHVLNLNHDPSKIAAVAFFHDMFSWSRHNHHSMAANWILTTDCPIVNEFSIEDRYDISVACGEHRASFKGEFTCEFSELMNAADREMPDITGRRILRRTLSCSLVANNIFHERLYKALDHIHEKFGIDGYARYPAMYEAAFSEQLKQQREAISKLTFTKALKLLKYPTEQG